MWAIGAAYNWAVTKVFDLKDETPRPPPFNSGETDMERNRREFEDMGY